MSGSSFSYDEVPYPSYAFPQTHPDRLATIARIHGIEAADPADCSVLELGCGDGTNLLSQAYSLPGSRFTGIDLSAVHIDAAKAAARELGLTNIEFQQADVSNVDTDRLGKFDFIVAHGLFSWVPDEIRPHILRIYSECLADRGVGYISYNLYPGCHIREIANGIMRSQTGRFDGYEQKVEYGKAFLKFVADAAEEGSLYQTMLRLELGQISERSPENVFHDDLSPLNQPLYFHEFASMIGERGMQYLAESDPAASNLSRISKNGRKMLEKMGDDIVGREQLLDLIACRRFRSSLVCRDGLQVVRGDGADRIGELYISSGMTSDEDEPDISGDAAVRFTGKKDAAVELNHPLTKAALYHLQSISPGNCKFSDLMTEAARLAGEGTSTDADLTRTRDFLFQMYRGGFVRLGLIQWEFAAEPGERPRSSDFARHQIGRGAESVVTLTGRNLEVLDPMTRLLIYLSDGSRDREALAADIIANVDVPTSQREGFAADLPQYVDKGLKELARSGLLIGQHDIFAE